MEFEVKLVGAINNCFVSLPLPLIQTLQSTRSLPVPQLLTLELRSRNQDLWFVAWSGATSASLAIEVASIYPELTLCYPLQYECGCRRRRCQLP